MSASTKIFRAALRLLPGRFRREYGAFMTRDFEELARSARQRGGRPRELWLLARAIFDLLRTAHRERRPPVRGVPTRNRRRRGYRDAFTLHLRDAFRSLRQKPGFSGLVIVTLALGIGANSAIFETVHAVLLSPLPFPEAERLVMLHETDRASGSIDNDVTPANFEDWRAASDSFDALAAFAPISMNLTGLGEPEQLSAFRVSASFLDVLGIQPARGRNFSREEDAPGAPLVVLVSHGFWQRRLGEGDVLGELIELDDERREIVGILPDSLHFPSREADVFVPFAMDAEEKSARSAHFLTVVGRTARGVTLLEAQQEMDAIARRLEETHPDTNADNGVVLAPLREQLVAGYETSLLLLLGAVGTVLLVSVVNVANLLLARSASRLRDVAVRSALGASRSRLLAQSLTEALVLSSAGGALGLMVGRASNTLLRVLLPSHLPLERAALQPTTLAFTAVLTLTVALGVGLLPALSLSRPGARALFQEGGVRHTDSVALARLRGLLVTSEIALALVLLIVGGLMVQSFVNLARVEPGFAADNVMTMKVELSGAKYDQHPQKVSFFQELEERIARLPGVTSTGVVSMLPLTATGGSIYFEREDQPPEPGVQPIAVFRSVSPGYFRTLGIALLRGRGFDARDRVDSVPVAVVSETLVRRFFADDEPLGKRLDIWGTSTEIVGIVADVRQLGYGQAARPAIYVAMAQRSFGYFDPKQVAVRTTSDPEALASSLRAEVWAIDPDQPVAAIRTMEDIVSGSVAEEKLRTWLYSSFAVVAVLLAAIGVYGLSSYAVSQRTGEIGLRMALGARRADVLRLVLSQGMKLALAGIAIGLVGAAGLVRLTEGFLFGVEPFELEVVAAATALLALVAMTATLVPAARASRIDATASLRAD